MIAAGQPPSSRASSSNAGRQPQDKQLDSEQQGATTAAGLQNGVGVAGGGGDMLLNGVRTPDDEAAPLSDQRQNQLQVNGGGGGGGRKGGSSVIAVVNSQSTDEEEEDDDDDAGGVRSRRGGFWGQQGSDADMADTGAAPRPKSRASGPDGAAKYNNLSYWRARKVTFYRNGDPFFPGVEFRFKPGRDIGSLEALLDKLSLRLDLPRGARYIFSMDGERKMRLEELEDGASYVCSSYKTFKPASYGKKSAAWYATPGNGPAWSKTPMSRKASLADGELPPPGGGNGKPSSGRVIRIVNSMDHTVQCRVLLNLRTSQPFEEVLEDLGQVLKMNGAKRMYTVSGQEVRSFSQLRNEFADVDTFYLGCAGRDVGGSPGRRSRSRANTHGGGGANQLMVQQEATRRARSKSRGRQPVDATDNLRGKGRWGSQPILDREPSPPAQAATQPPAPRSGRWDNRSRLYDPDDGGDSVGGGGMQPGGVSDYTLLEVLKEEPIRVTIRGMRRTFYPPLHHPAGDTAPPEKRLQLAWVHGYRGTDSHRNLWVLPTGELLYYVAAVAILFDRDEDGQRHYTGHTEDIQCMDLHPSREMVASGQRAGRSRKTQAHIRIWSTESLLTLYVFGMGELEVGVSAVAFSQLAFPPTMKNGGSYVLAVDGGRERILSVWQWQWGHLLGKVATLQDDLTGAVFHPLDDNLLITHGKGHLTFWTRRKDGFFERTDIIKPPSRTNVTSIQFEQDGDVVTADGDGFITIYSVDSDGAYFVRMEFEAHNKGISSLIMLSEGTLLSGGEKDRKIIAWDSLQNYKKVTESKLPESAGGVRSIYPQRPGRNDGNIYVGTTRNNIMEGSLQRRFNQVLFGHSRQLWGLAVHPDDELFATGGQDKMVALWRRSKMLWCVQIAYECVSLCFHPFGVALAAGSSEGYLVILNAENGGPVASVRVCGSPLNCVGYNPAGDTIAVGSQNGSIYLFRVSRDGFSYKKSNKIRGAQPLIQMDWSTDGSFLQTVTSDYDLTFWDVKSLTAEKSAVAMKDVKWYTHNSTIGFLVAGIWNNRYYPMTSLIVTANRSSAHDLLVCGDADGYLRLFRYPCLSAKAEYNEEKVYSMQIAVARFLFNDKNVATVGGTDASLMLWDVVDD